MAIFWGAIFLGGNFLGEGGANYFMEPFKTALYAVEVEVVFQNFIGLVDLQRQNGVKVGSADNVKINSMGRND